MKERRAEETLSKSRASFMYGPAPPARSVSSILRYAYQKAVQVVWRERFVTSVSLTSSLTADEVSALGNLPHVESMYLDAARLTGTEKAALYGDHVEQAKHPLPPGAIRQILTNKSLRNLGLGLWVLADDDSAEIGRNPSLELVSVDTSHVSEQGLVYLLKAPSLPRFGFSWCCVTGSGLASAPGSKTLESIECQVTPVCPEFAAFVRRSPNVRTLAIAHQSINDEFVSRLAEHPALWAINLSGSSVSDSCIADLKRWKTLGAVCLPRGGISEAAIQELKSARPTISISTE